MIIKNSILMADFFKQLLINFGKPSLRETRLSDGIHSISNLVSEIKNMKRPSKHSHRKYNKPAKSSRKKGSGRSSNRVVSLAPQIEKGNVIVKRHISGGKRSKTFAERVMLCNQQPTHYELRDEQLFSCPQAQSLVIDLYANSSNDVGTMLDMIAVDQSSLDQRVLQKQLVCTYRFINQSNLAIEIEFFETRPRYDTSQAIITNVRNSTAAYAAIPSHAPFSTAPVNAASSWIPSIGGAVNTLQPVVPTNSYNTSAVSNAALGPYDFNPFTCGEFTCARKVIRHVKRTLSPGQSMTYSYVNPREVMLLTQRFGTGAPVEPATFLHDRTFELLVMVRGLPVAGTAPSSIKQGTLGSALVQIDTHKVYECVAWLGTSQKIVAYAAPPVNGQTGIAVNPTFENPDTDSAIAEAWAI